MERFKKQQYNIKTAHVAVSDGYYQAKVFVDSLSNYHQLRQKAGNQINDDFISKMSDAARFYIGTKRKGKYFNKKSQLPRCKYFQEYIPNSKNKDKMLVNVGMMIEMHRAGYGDLDYYWQKLRFLAKNKGGYFRNPKDNRKYSSTFYEKVAALKKLGFITNNKVLNYRKITFKYSPVQQWVAIDKSFLESKKTYKSFLLAVTEAYQLEGGYKSSKNKVTKFDPVKRIWNREQYNRNSLYEVKTWKFNDDNLSFITGRISDSCLTSFLSSDKYKTSVSTKTLQRWRKHCRFNNYSTYHLYIPIKGLKFTDKKYRKNSKMYSYGKNKMYFTHVDRKTLSAIPIFNIKSLKTRYLLETYKGSYTKDNLPFIGDDIYTPQDSTISGLKRSIGKNKAIIFELLQDDQMKVSENKIGYIFPKSHKDKKDLTSLGYKENYTQFKNTSLTNNSSKIKEDIENKYLSNVQSNILANEEYNTRHKRDLLMN